MLSTGIKSEPSVLSSTGNIIKTAIPIAMSYDVSILTFVLNRLLTRLGYDTMAPVAITLFSTLIYAQLAATLPVNMQLPHLFTKRKEFLANDETKEVEQKAERANQLSDINDVNEQSSPLTVQINEPLLAPAETLPESLAEVDEQIVKTLKNGWLASSAMGALAVITLLLSHNMLRAFGQDEKEVAAPAGDFFTPLAPFFLAFPLRMTLEFAILAAKKERLAMGMTLPVLATLIASQYIFPSSLKTLGLTLGGSFITTALLLSLYLQYNLKDINFFRTFVNPSSFDRKQILTHLSTSLPFIITMSSDVSVFFILSLIASKISLDALASWSVGAFTLTISAWLAAAVSQAAWLTVAELKAEKYPIKNAIYAGLLATVAVQVLALGISIPIPEFFATYIAGAPADATLNLATSAMVVTSAIALGLQTTALTITRNLGETSLKFTLAASAALWLGVGISYGFSYINSFGLAAVPSGLAIGACLSAQMVLSRLFNSQLTQTPAPEFADNNNFPRSDSAIQTPPTAASRLLSCCGAFRSRSSSQSSYAPILEEPAPRMLGCCPC